MKIGHDTDAFNALDEAILEFESVNKKHKDSYYDVAMEKETIFKPNKVEVKIRTCFSPDRWIIGFGTTEAEALKNALLQVKEKWPKPKTKKEKKSLTSKLKDQNIFINKGHIRSTM